MENRMTGPMAIDVQALIARPSAGRFRRMVLFLGFGIIALEGFDLTLMGFVAPVLRQQWRVSDQALGPALSAAQVGLLLGALSAGPLADRFGRRPMLLISVAIFGLFTLLAAFAGDLPELILLRFLTGIGVGSVMPTTATLISEYVAERIRSLSVAFIVCGVAFSSACAGFLSAWMIPSFGWRSLFLAGGLAPLLMMPVLWRLLPESAAFLVASRAPEARIRAIVDRMAPGEAPARPAPCASPESGAGGALELIFSRAYRFGGLMLWIAYSSALFTSNMLSSWLPTLIKETGYSLSYAAVVTAVYQLGGVGGALFLGWTMHGDNQHRGPAGAYFASGALFLGFALALHSAPLTLLQAFALGFCLIGAISCINALPTAFYPTKARATGSCWMHGAGRCGALASIFSGAQMLTMGWSAKWVFMALIAPALTAGLALLVKARYAAGPALGARSLASRPHGLS